jgi:hypothetical protein
VRKHNQRQTVRLSYKGDKTMTAQKLIRWSGLLSIVAAVLFMLFGLLRMGGPNLRGWVFSFLFFIVLVFAVIGLYVVQVEPSGWLGLVAFVLSALGAMLMSTGNLLSIAEFSGVREAQAVETFYSTTVPLGIIAPLCFFGGQLLFGIATLRAGVLPRGAGILLSVGAVVTPVGFFTLPPLALLLGIVLFASALAWMGWALWS